MAAKRPLRDDDAAATGSDSGEENVQQQEAAVVSTGSARVDLELTASSSTVETVETYGEGDSAETTVEVTVPPLEKTVFPSWEAFHAYLAEYQQRTLQVYSIRTATPVAARNKRILERYARNGQPVPPGELLPVKMGAYSKAVVCTHYGHPRSRSTGVRPRQRSRAINCSAQITAVLRRDYTSGQCFVYVSSHRTRHNHTLSDGQYRKHPHVRKITDPSVLRTVQALQRAGVQPTKILEYVRESTDKQVVPKDVHNLLAAMRKGSPLPPLSQSPAPSSRVPPLTPATLQKPTQYGKFLASFNVGKQISELLAEMDADRFAHCYAELGMFLRIAESGRLPIVTTREAMNHAHSHVLADASGASVPPSQSFVGTNVSHNSVAGVSNAGPAHSLLSPDPSISAD
ncbi:hypothetical protein BBJ28_00008917 [Nothophytophthora sp. Chile5]|nr:hypothetical protein BBJ28_00008917 [Nothophytophthora sp. Chile5]